MNKKSIWLNNSFFDWTSYNESSSSCDTEKMYRAYELWNHAKQTLDSTNTELYRTDAISTLRRCFNQRLIVIEERYKFKEISNLNKKKYLEILESFNLIRPLMLDKLLTIRNDIEHRDAKPPNHERCMELLDLIWYFLKSTDNLILWRKEDISYTLLTDSGEETQYEISINIDFEANHKMNISGWCQNNFISDTKKNDFIKIHLDDFGTKKERWNNTNNHNDKLEDDIWINGYIEADKELKFKIVKNSLSSR